MSVAFTWKCELKEGVHARPAGYIERLCNLFQADVAWTNTRTGLSGSARSALSIIATDTLFADECQIVLSGEDEADAASLLGDLLENLDSYKTVQEETPDLGEGYLPRSLLETQPEFIQGARISGGIAIAKPLIVHNLTLAEILARDPGGAVDVPKERAWLSEGICTLRQQKEALLTTTSSLEHDILEAHVSIITDSDFLTRILDYIADNRTAWAAVAMAARDLCDMLRASSSRYINERTLDVFDIAIQLLTTLYGEKALPQLHLSLDSPTIIFANSLTPSQFLAINKTWLAGMVLSSAGKTSHTTILARSLGIPTLTGIDFSALELPADQEMVLDGELGGLLITPNARVRHYYRTEIAVRQKMQQQMLSSVHSPAMTADEHRLDIAANIASLAEAQSAFENGAESIGLFRTEMSFIDRETPPDYDELAALYTAVVQVAQGKPVIFRTFDIGGDKPAPWLESVEEDNPFLGFRAVRTYPHYRALFMMQLKAILAASAVGDARIMLPMVSNVDEVVWCREVLEAAKQEMRADGLAFNDAIALGVMLEVPSVIFAIADIAEVADFFSVGTNDLTQYFFAADRGNTQVNGIYDNYAPAFLRAIHFAVQEVHRAGKWIGLCGELGSSKAFLPIFTGMGFDELSMSSPAIPGVKQALRELNYGKCQSLVSTLVQAKRASEVRELLRVAQVKDIAQKPLLAPEFVLWDLEAADKNEVIKKMVDNLWLQRRTDNRHQLCDDVWMREEPFPTVAGNGFAIPHARSAHVSDSTISVAKLTRPVFWGGQQVDTVFMLTIGEASSDNEHMKYFSTLARMLMNDEFIKNTKNSSTSAALYNQVARTLAF